MGTFNLIPGMGGNDYDPSKGPPKISKAKMAIGLLVNPAMMVDELVSHGRNKRAYERYQQAGSPRVASRQAAPARSSGWNIRRGPDAPATSRSSSVGTGPRTAAAARPPRAQLLPRSAVTIKRADSNIRTSERGWKPAPGRYGRIAGNTRQGTTSVSFGKTPKR